MVIILVEFLIEEVEDRDLHHALIEIGGSILDNLDCDHLLRLQILAFDYLAEGSLAKNIEYEIPILMSIFFVTKYVIDEEDVVTIFIVVSVILNSFAWLCEDSARVSRGLVFERRVTYTVSRRKMGRQGLQRLEN